MPDQMIQVLLVEDGPTDALIVREELTQGSGIMFNVTHVERLAEAFEQLKEQAFGVVLLDLSLPDSDGFETFTRLREEAVDVPVIVLSGRTDEDLAVKAVQSGAQDYLVKGHMEDQVLARAIRYAIERKRSEVALRQQALTLEKKNLELSLLSTCITNSNDIVLITEATPIDEPGPRIVFVNEAFERIVGYSPAEAMGRSPRFLQGEKTERSVLREIRQALAEQKSIRRDLVNYGKDGSEYWLDIDISPVFDPAGKCTHFVAIERDITEQKRAGEILRASETRYRSLISATAQIVWTVEADGKVLGALPEWQKFTGQSIEEVQGDGWAAAVHPEDAEHAVKVWMESVQGKGTFETEFRLRRSDGVYRNVSSRGVPVLGEDGAIREWVGCCMDITERREGEKQIQAQLYELQRWRRAMLGREDRVQTLKKEINEILRQLGKPPRYADRKTEQAGII